MVRPSMYLGLRQWTSRRRGCHLSGLVILTLLLLFLTISFMVLDDRQAHTLLSRNSIVRFFQKTKSPAKMISKFSPEIGPPGLPDPDPRVTPQPFQRRPFWILPNTAPSGDVPEMADHWGVFVPTELKSKYSATCKTCYNEDAHALLTFLYDVTEISRSDPLSKMHIIRKMAALLFLVKEQTRGVLQTSDYSSVVKSVERFLHDDQPYGVPGLEFIGDELTQSSLHYLFYSGRNYTKPCQYKIRYRMKPLWTVGVRCLSLQDDGLPEKVSLVDRRSPPIFASAPKFSIDTFADSFFSYAGLWASFASIFDDGVKTGVWSLWAQRMMQEVGGQVAVVPLACPPNRKVVPVGIEPDAKIKKAFNFVTKWSCAKGTSFFACSRLLVSELRNLGCLKPDDVILHKLWLQGLAEVGHPEPKRVSNAINTNDVIPFCVMHTPALIAPPPEKPKSTNLFPSLVTPCQKAPPPQKSKYFTVDPFLDYHIPKPPKTENIAVIVLFYHPSYYKKNMPILYDLYDKYFPNFIFCGPDYNHFSNFQQAFRKPVGFIEVRDTHAFVAQECLTRAMIMNLDVSGYLQFADDNLMNTWQIGDLPRDRLWFQHEVLITSRYSEYIADFFLKTVPWAFWKGYNGRFGKDRIQKVWDRFDAIAKENNPNAKEIVESFRKTLAENSGNSTNIYYQASDVFYVPARLRRNWIFLADIFSVNDVFLEIAIPTLIYGMDKFDNVLKMSGNYLWYKDRPQYLKYYQFNHHFQHPWKVTWLSKPKDREFMCYGVLGEIVKERTAK